MWHTLILGNTPVDSKVFSTISSKLLLSVDILVGRLRLANRMYIVIEYVTYVKNVYKSDTYG